MGNSLFYYSTSFIFANISHPKNLLKFIQYIYFFLRKDNIYIRPKVLLGLAMFIDVNSHADRNIFFHGVVDQDLTNYLKKNIKPDSVFFDIGANSGFFSLLASKLAKRGSVHAFEPVPSVFHNLEKSIKKNNISNIIANQLCLSNKTGMTPFYVSYHSDVSSVKKTSYQKKHKLIKVKTITLNSYCQNNNIKKIDIIKIDTEGSEKNILFSSKKILNTYKPTLVVEFSNITAKAFHYHPSDIYDFLQKQGYRMFSIRNGMLTFQPKKEYYLENLYCIHKSRSHES